MNKSQRTKATGSGMPRASISFPQELYHALEELAKQKKVSLAWVIRDAAERYVSAEVVPRNAVRRGTK